MVGLPNVLGFNRVKNDRRIKTTKQNVCILYTNKEGEETQMRKNENNHTIVVLYEELL